MRDRIPGIPTEWRGVQYRSRLECRYAIFFTLLGISFEYECLDLAGYIPDFIVDAQIFSEPQVPGPVLVEVRPVLREDEFAEPIAKIARSGWNGGAMVVGATMFPQDKPWGRETPFGRAHGMVKPEHAANVDEWFPVGWYRNRKQFGMGGDDVTAEWNESGKRTQWMPRRP